MSAKLLLIGNRCRADACVCAMFPRILPLPLRYRDCNVEIRDSSRSTLTLV